MSLEKWRVVKAKMIITAKVFKKLIFFLFTKNIFFIPSTKRYHYLKFQVILLNSLLSIVTPFLRYNKKVRKLNSDQFRNFIFGAEDSLVSTLGILFGIASAGEFNQHQIFLAGIIAIVVEATSMGAGSFLSESSAMEIDGDTKLSPLTDGIIMFFSYFLSGFIPLTPYLLLEVGSAKYVSILFTLLALFILGYLPAKSPKSGLKMALVAGTAAGIGFLVAHIFSV